MGSRQLLLDPSQVYQTVGSLTLKAEMCTPDPKVKREERGCKANAGVDLGSPINGYMLCGGDCGKL